MPGGPARSPPPACASATASQPARHNGKKINGRKRHIAVDTAGLLLAVVVAASTQDRDGAKPLLWNLRRVPPA
jgi:predicted transcriptional regulator